MNGRREALQHALFVLALAGGWVILVVTLWWAAGLVL